MNNFIEKKIEEFDKEFVASNIGKIYNWKATSLIDCSGVRLFIRQALQDQEELIYDKIKTDPDSFPYSISVWENLGKSRGYWDYFEKKVVTKALESVRLDEIDIDESGDFETDSAMSYLRQGYLRAIQDLNEKINNYLK